MIHELIRLISDKVYEKISPILTTVGGSLGFLSGLKNYWEHFSKDVSYPLIDSCITTASHTFIGTVGAYFLVMIMKKLFPQKKEDK